MQHHASYYITQAHTLCGARCGAEVLTDLKARKAASGGKPLPDGTVVGLRLEPGTLRGHGKWILRFVSPVTKRRRDMGLGVYPDVGIADAREKGTAARRLIAKGIDPIEARGATTRAMTFEQAARRVHMEQAPGWKNAKHADQWLTTLRDHVFSVLGDESVTSLTPAKFAEALRPMWLAKPETAMRVKQRCRTVMSWCWAQGLVNGNPVDVVHHLLPPQPGKRERVQHRPAMPWRDIPAFMQEISGLGALQLVVEFIILTAARSGEVRAMTWAEIDLNARIWTIPSSHMKAKVTHRIPLSTRATVILMESPRRAGLVFPSPSSDGMLRDAALMKVLHRYTPCGAATIHGFRSSFRDWASENGYPRDLAERALAHTIASQSEAAYHRTDLLEQRRPMMESWASFVHGDLA